MNKVRYFFQLLGIVGVTIMLVGCASWKGYIQQQQQNEEEVIESVASISFIARDIAAAQERYFEQNYRYAGKISDLDVQIPAEVCSHIDYENYQLTDNGDLLACGKDFIIDNFATSGAVYLDFCPNHTNTWKSCVDNRVLRLDYNLRYNDTWPNSHWCTVFNYSHPNYNAHNICSKFSGFVERSASNIKAQPRGNK